MFIIRKAESCDLIAINEIYNWAVLYTVATFDTEPMTLENRNFWFEQHRKRYPVLVAEEDTRILGWASLSRYSERPAYSITAEISAYVNEQDQRRGVGRKLTERIIIEGREAGLHTILARITTDNLVSMRLAEELGFKHVGVMKEVGKKFDKLLDVDILQFIYS